MTNFRLFQTQSVCRRQYKIWWKWQKAVQTGKKHCGKRRNCSLRAISPFPTVFSKDLYCRHLKTRACLGKGFNFVFRMVSFCDMLTYRPTFLLKAEFIYSQRSKPFFLLQKELASSFTVSNGFFRAVSLAKMRQRLVLFRWNTGKSWLMWVVI